MLVICTNPEKLPNVETCEFKKNEIYRHLELTENKRKEHMVYGVVFSDETFVECFKPLAPVFKKMVEKTAFIENGKPVSKSEFAKNVVDIHTYGRGMGKYFIAVVGNPRENCFLIYPYHGSTKAEAIKFAYESMLQLLDENVATVDSNRVRWTDRGIPISYNGMYAKPISESYNTSLFQTLLAE